MSRVGKSRAWRGDGLVEFALMLPVLILLVMGILDLGRAVYAYSAISNAAREAARQGIINPNNPDLLMDVARQWSIGLDDDNLEIAPDYDEGAGTIQVTVSYRFYPVTPLVSRIISGQGYLTLTTRSRMTVEQ